jgi:hypothetical protein
MQMMKQYKARKKWKTKKTTEKKTGGKIKRKRERLI